MNLRPDRIRKKPPAGQANKDVLFLILCALVPRAAVETEHRFHPKRMWRFDYAIPLLKLAVEYDGINTGGGHAGRHTSVTGVAGDHEKINEAILLGWRVLRFTKLNFREADRQKHKLSAPGDVIRAAIQAVPDFQSLLAGVPVQPVQTNLL